MLAQKVSDIIKNSALKDNVVFISTTNQRQRRITIEFRDGIVVSLPMQMNVSDDELLSLITSTYEKKLANQ